MEKLLRNIDSKEFANTDNIPSKLFQLSAAMLRTPLTNAVYKSISTSVSPRDDLKGNYVFNI